MFNKIKSKFKSDDNKKLFSNFISLSILQGANYILPLITFPYLVRVLGVENFGLIAFATATVAYFSLLIGYGFNLSATRQISINREDQKKVNEIVSSIICIQLIFFMISLIFLTIIIFSFEKFSEHWYIYYLIYSAALGNIMFPIWFYQGIERMKYITYLNLFSKAIYAVCIFVFIHNEDDFYFVPLINSILTFIIGFISIWLISNIFHVKFILPTKLNMIYQVKEGWHMFISNIAVNLYTTSTIFILGLFTNNTVVGYFAAGEKLIKAVNGLIQPVSQVIYPHIAKLVEISKESGLKFIRKIIVLIGTVTFISSFLLFIYAEEIVNLVLGENYRDSIIIVQIMSFLPFVVGLGNVFGIQTMLNFGMKKEFSQILVIGSIINLLLSFILIPIFEHVGSAISVMVVDVLITLIMYIFLQNKGISIIKGKIV